MTDLTAVTTTLLTTVTTDAPPVTTARYSPPGHPDTLIDLCRLWPLLRHHDGSDSRPPSICSDPRFTHYLRKDGVLPVADRDAITYIHNQQKLYEYEMGRKRADQQFFPVKHRERGDGMHTGFIGRVQYSGRSISLVGILGGIIFILLMIACATCIKHRKKYPMEPRQDDRLARQMIAEHIRQVTHGRHSTAGLLAYRPDKPPDYDTVVKEEDGDLPSYVEAVGGGELTQVVVVPDSNSAGQEGQESPREATAESSV